MAIATNALYNLVAHEQWFDYARTITPLCLISINFRRLSGMAVARDMNGKDNHVVSVIGDGAMTAGQAYEAMNNAGFLDTNLIVILNDNKQVSLPTATIDGPVPPVGALSRALARLQTTPKFHQLRQAAKVTLLIILLGPSPIHYST